MRGAAGFTMVELVMIILIIGILAVVAIPRMGTSEFRALDFHDQVVAALRYAQKTATSHRRMVCVEFTAPSVTLTIDHDKSGACDGQTLMLPGSSTNYVWSGDEVNAVFNPVPANFRFQSDGTTNADIPPLQISGQEPIVVVRATGYVK